jgi:hypothetical protein
MDEAIESHLRFPVDGKTGHYYVERYDTSKDGRINVIYTTDSNSLEVDCSNIKVLRLYCREMYEKKSVEVFKRDPDLDSNYYKTYFIERDHFHVQVYTEQTIQKLEFIDTPVPYNVTVNGQEWWLTGVNYTYNYDGIVLTKVPPGNNYVDIYFKIQNNKAPVADFTVSHTVISVGESITVNASNSYDPDGEITNYVWDYGESTYKGGITSFHTFSAEGNYKIILTVTDDDDLIDRAYHDIKVVRRIMGISKFVDKPTVSPGSNLLYSFNLTLDDTWFSGVKDINIIDILPKELEYLDATPMPEYKNHTVIWKLGMLFDNSELPKITLRVHVKDSAENNTIITNYATLE